MRDYSKCEWYQNIDSAAKCGQLVGILSSEPRYRMFTIPGADVMNDFRQVAYALNLYALNHPDFEKQLQKAIDEILNSGKLYYIYSVIMFFKAQLSIERDGKNVIQMFDDKLLDKMKEVINANKEDFMSIKSYTGSLYSDGMYGEFRGISDSSVRTRGRGII